MKAGDEGEEKKGENDRYGDADEGEGGEYKRERWKKEEIKEMYGKEERQ